MTPSRRDLLRAGATGLATVAAGCNRLSQSSVGAWSYQVEFGRVGRPVFAEGTVYAGAEDKAVHAVDATTGERQWRYETGGSCARRLALGGNGVVYVESEDAILYALRDGTVRWRFETHAVAPRPILADGTVYLPDRAYVEGKDRGCLHALDARTGERRWTFRTDREFVAFSAVAGDTVVCTDRETHKARRSRVYALNDETGEPRWSAERRGRVVADAQGDVVAALALRQEVNDSGDDVADDELCVFDLETGRRRWSRTVGPNGTDAVRVADRRVLHSLSGSLVAREAATGKERWRVERFTGRRATSFQVADGTVYLATRDDTEDRAAIVAADVRDGTRRWRQPIDGITKIDRVALSGDAVYASSTFNPWRVVKLDADTGQQQWSHSVERGSAWTAGDGAVYLGTHEARLVALG